MKTEFTPEQIKLINDALSQIDLSLDFNSDKESETDLNRDFLNKAKESIEKALELS